MKYLVNLLIGIIDLFSHNNYCGYTFLNVLLFNIWYEVTVEDLRRIDMKNDDIYRIIGVRLDFEKRLLRDSTLYFRIVKIIYRFSPLFYMTNAWNFYKQEKESFLFFYLTLNTVLLFVKYISFHVWFNYRYFWFFRTEMNIYNLCSNIQFKYQIEYLNLVVFLIALYLKYPFKKIEHK